VGFAYTTRTSFKLYKFLSEPSIFKVESQTIKETLIHTNTKMDNKILIISDSLSALLALESHNPSNEIIQQIHNIIAKSNKIIQFMWVPSHIDIPGNEKVDVLANEATTSPVATIINTLTYQDILKK